MARLTLGVIGAGTWAVAAHLPAFAARDDVEPLIVCRRDAAVLARIQERFGFAQATTDWREVIAARPDLVVLTGPVGARAEQAQGSPGGGRARPRREAVHGHATRGARAGSAGPRPGSDAHAVLRLE